jgi:hypothetical protein
MCGWSGVCSPLCKGVVIEVVSVVIEDARQRDAPPRHVWALGPCIVTSHAWVVVCIRWCGGSWPWCALEGVPPGTMCTPCHHFEVAPTPAGHALLQCATQSHCKRGGEAADAEGGLPAPSQASPWCCSSTHSVAETTQWCPPHHHHRARCRVCAGLPSC